tara:strand:- start:104 stop:391 length:288 start_codon:yes stop_codon:yes gene_type:complete
MDSNTDNILHSLDAKHSEAKRLGVMLSRRYRIEDFLRARGIDIPKGNIRLGAVGRQDSNGRNHIIAFRVNGERHELDKPISDYHWVEQFGPLEPK